MGEKELGEKFPFLSFAEDEEEEIVPHVFIEEANFEITELFDDIFKNYLTGSIKANSLRLDTTVILAVLSEKTKPITQSLKAIKHLWIGYYSVIQENINEREG